MNWKQIVYKGLPVLLITAAIVIIAAIASRPEPQPEVTKEEDKVLDFKDLSVTKGQLYEMLKQNYGVSSLVDMIDRKLLADYEDQVDMEALKDKIKADKKSQTEEIFYQNMVAANIIESKDQADAEEKIEDYYLLSFLQKAYATQVATDNLTETEIKDAKDNYHPDMCIITLSFDTTNAASDFADDLATNTDKLAFFEAEYKKEGNKVDPTKNESSEDVPAFYESAFSCSYDLISYNSSRESQAFLDFVYSTEYKNEDFGIGDYTKDPKYISGEGYYFVYKIAEPDFIANYKQSTEFNDYIVDELITGQVDQGYIHDQILSLHQEAGLKIYDKVIGDYYTTAFDKDFKIQEKLLKSDNNVVATYKLDGKTEKISADDIYDKMKKTYGVQVLLEKVNFEALSNIKDIQLSKKEKEDIVTQITQIKKQFLGSQQNFTWSQFMSLYYGAFSEEELANIFAGPQLTERYILGYKDYPGANPITDEAVQAAYADWFNITASHILFEFDDTDDAAKEEAYQKGLQIIYGCTDEDENGDPVYVDKLVEGKQFTVTEETCKIFYGTDDQGEPKPFAGLDETPEADFKTVFGDLAIKYSDEQAAATSKGSLGTFGPNKMVDEFEAAAKVIADRIKTGEDLGIPYSLTPVLTEFGYHVIYVTGQKEKTEKPADYDQYLADKENDNVVIADKYTQEQITAFNKYEQFLNTIKSNLEAEYKTAVNENQQLALLRNDKGFEFKDKELQAIYARLNALQISAGEENNQ